MDASPDLPTLISGLLRQHRVDRDLTIEALSERSGVSDRTIGDIERGVSVSPRGRTIAALADGLALSGEAREHFLRAARDARREVHPAATGDAHRPHRLEDFTGRDAEVAELVALLAIDATTDEASAPIVVSGSPGVGKTSLVVEAVRRIGLTEHRELFLDLGSATQRPLTPLRVLQSLIGQLVPERDTPGTVAGASALWRELTAAQPVMVILDDAAMEAQVRPVLGFDARSRLIVTSRRSLAGLETARHLGISAMTREESIRLLECAIPPEQRSATDLDELAALCGDLPLALRVAVGRITAQKSRNAEEFSRRLKAEDRRLKLLVAGDLGVERAFAASCYLLAPTPRRLFQRLSLLRGTSFDAALGAAVGGIELADSQDLLDELVDLGLVEALEGDRFRLHDLLRLYAEQVFAAEAPAEVIAESQLRVNRWVLAAAARAGEQFAPHPESSQSHATLPAIVFADRGEARAWLTQEVQYWFPALHEAATHGRHDEVLRAVASIRWFGSYWEQWGRWHEVFELAIASARASDDRGREALLHADLAYMQLWEQGDPERSLATAQRGLELARESGDDEARAHVLQQLADTERLLGHSAAAEAHARESIQAFTGIGQFENSMDPRVLLARLLTADDPEKGAEEFQRLLAIVADPATPLGPDPRTEIRLQCLGGVVRSYITLERFEEALVAAIAMTDHHSDNPLDLARALRHRGFAYLGLGEADKARADLALALEMAGPHRPDDWAAEIQQALREL